MRSSLSPLHRKSMLVLQFTPYLPSSSRHWSLNSADEKPWFNSFSIWSALSSVSLRFASAPKEADTVFGSRTASAPLLSPPRGSKRQTYFSKRFFSKGFSPKSAANSSQFSNTSSNVAAPFRSHHSHEYFSKRFFSKGFSPKSA